MGKLTYLADNGNVIPIDTLIDSYFEILASTTGMIETLEQIISKTTFNEEQYTQLIMVKKALQQHAAELDELVVADYPFEERLRKLKKKRPGEINPDLEAVLREAHANQTDDKED